MPSRRAGIDVEFPGHVGASLVAYSPLAYLALRAGSTRLALAGALLAVALASFPDVDEHDARLTHRGTTHTVWFALVVGTGCTAAFALAFAAPGGVPIAGAVGDAVQPLVLRPAVFGFVVGTLTTLVHVAADAITPMGVAPLAPLWRRRVSLDLVSSADPVANRRLLLAGVLATAAAVGLGGL